MKIEEAIVYCLTTSNRGMRTEQIADTLLQCQLQLLLGALLQGGAGVEIHAGKYRQQNGGDNEHGGGHHFPAKLADHSSTSRQ